MTKEDITALLQIMEKSYLHWTQGEELPVPEAEIYRKYDWLDNDAPFGLLVHNTMDDPIFIYANKAAQKIFNYTLEEFLSLPSRLSASTSAQTDRNRLLQEIEDNGIAHGYKGIRINKQGEKFTISKGSIWQIIDDSGKRFGTAAMIWV